MTNSRPPTRWVFTHAEVARKGPRRANAHQIVRAYLRQIVADHHEQDSNGHEHDPRHLEGDAQGSRHQESLEQTEQRYRRDPDRAIGLAGALEIRLPRLEPRDRGKDGGERCRQDGGGQHAHRLVGEDVGRSRGGPNGPEPARPTAAETKPTPPPPTWPG